MQRLATLVPRPRLNLIRFHGVLAPNAKLRPEIIPDTQKNEKNTSDAQDDAPHSSVSVRISWARLLKWVFDIDIEHCPDLLRSHSIYSKWPDFTPTPRFNPVQYLSRPSPLVIIVPKHQNGSKPLPHCPFRSPKNHIFLSINIGIDKLRALQYIPIG